MNYICNFAEDINIFIVFILKLLLYNLSTQCKCAISSDLTFKLQQTGSNTIMASIYNKATLYYRHYLK
jgi:hypothetical protein